MSIHTRFLPCTNHRGSRIKATSTSGVKLTVEYDHAISAHENHMRVAAKLLSRLEGAPKLSDCRVGESESGRGYTVTWGIAYSAGADNV